MWESLFTGATISAFLFTVLTVILSIRLSQKSFVHSHYSGEFNCIAFVKYLSIAGSTQTLVHPGRGGGEVSY